MSRVHVNLGTTWAEVGVIPTGGGKFVRDAFAGGKAEKVTLAPGTVLYKFNGYPNLNGTDPGAAIRGVSPWWSPYEAFRHDPGWEQKRLMAKQFGVSVREWGRITSAVKENWNSLEYLLIVTLKHHADGYFGGFAQMDRIDPDAKSLALTPANRPGFTGRAEGAGLGTQPGKFTSAGMRERIATHGSRGTLAGGGTQFYIPNLRPMNIASWRVLPLVAL
jgi:hypothetical protein